MQCVSQSVWNETEKLTSRHILVFFSIFHVIDDARNMQHSWVCVCVQESEVERTSLREEVKKYNKVNDKANVVEFHGRRLKSLGTRFENTYVIACSYIDISCSLTWVRSGKKWDKCKSEKKNITFPVCYIQDVCKKSSTKSAKTTDAYKHTRTLHFTYTNIRSSKQHC